MGFKTKGSISLPKQSPLVQESWHLNKMGERSGDILRTLSGGLLR